MIGIYKDNESQTLSHLCDTIEQASKWIGSSTQALYKSFHVLGVMKAKGFIVERVKDEPIKDNTCYVKYKEKSNLNIIHEKGSLNGQALNFITLDNLRDQLENESIIILDIKTTKESERK